MRRKRRPVVARDQGAPETRARLRYDVLRRITAKGHIDNLQATAAEQILDIQQTLQTLVWPRTIFTRLTFEKPSGGTSTAPIEGMPEALRRAWSHTYIPWANGEGEVIVGTSTRLDLVWSVVIDNNPLSAVERRHKIRHGSSLGHLRDSLGRYVEVAGW